MSQFCREIMVNIPAPWNILGYTDFLFKTLLTSGISPFLAMFDFGEYLKNTMCGPYGHDKPLSAASISIQWRPSISVFPSASGPVWPAWLGRGPWSSRCRNRGIPGGWSLDLDMTWPIQVQNINGHDSGTD